MSTLHATRSRGLLHRIPRWAFIVLAACVGLALVGTGLLLTSSNDTKSVATPAPSCTPTAAATAPPTAVVKVNVYNATSRAGLAASTAQELTARGFTVDKVANDPKNADVAGTADIRYVSGSEQAARWVAAQVPGAELAKIPATNHKGASIDLVVGDAFTAFATTDAARVAYAASAPKAAC